MARISIGRRRAIALLALTSILLITLDSQGSPVVDRMRGVFATVFSPLQGATRVVTRPVENAWIGITDAGDLRAENERLKEEIARQEGASLAALASLRDAQEILALNGIEGLQGIQSKVARVIGDTPSNFSQTVEIDIGSTDGVKVGMPVVDSVGLVGKITAVNPTSSVVMLVTDAEYAITVKVTNNPNFGQTGEPAVTTTAPPATAPSGQVPGAGATTTTSTTTTTTTVPTTTTTLPATTTTTVAPAPLDPLGPVPGVTTTTLGIDDLPATERGGFFGRGGSATPEIEFVQASARFGEIRVGAIVQTAGGSQSPAPENIVVGTVQRIIERSSSAGPVLEVRVAARLTDLNLVRVLLYQSSVDAGG